MISLICSSLCFQVQYQNIRRGEKRIIFSFHILFIFSNVVKEYVSRIFLSFSCTEKLFWLFFGIYHHNRSILLTWKSNIIFISLLFLYHMLYLSITNRYLTKRPENKKNSREKVRNIIDYLVKKQIEIMNLLIK